MPLDQKRSILVPVIKRAGLDPTDPCNFRPIAKVSLISKVIEKIIAYQLVPYLEANNLIPAIQSGFRKDHSTETLLFRLLSDMYGAIDRSQLTLLALFDVSAAFDTVWYMGQPGPHGFPLHMAYLRVPSWVPYSTSFILPTLLLFLPLTLR